MYCSTLIFSSPFITPTKTPIKTHFFSLPRRTEIRKHYRLKNPINFSLDKPPKAPLPNFKPQENEKKNNGRLNIEENALSRFAKPLAACTLFWLAIGLCPIRPLQLPSLAAVSAETTDVSNYDKDYSNYTQKMVESVVKLRRTVRKVWSGNGDVKEVETALGEVKSKRKEFQEAIENEMEVELDALREELEALNDRAEMVNESMERARSESQTLLADGEGSEKVKLSLAKAEEVLGKTGEEYDGIWKRIGETEELISKKEFMAFTVCARQLQFLERESTLLVDNFTREMRQKNING